jgi:hypothetical protein
MGARLTELDAKYRALNTAHGGRPSLSDGMAALRDLAGLIVEAKQAQVEALNAHDFSLAEYDWVRKSVYAASGVPITVDFGHLIEQASTGQMPQNSTLAEAVTGEVPEKNRELVAPHEAVLKENAALAFFGL